MEMTSNRFNPEQEVMAAVKNATVMIPNDFMVHLLPLALLPIRANGKSTATWSPAIFLLPGRVGFETKYSCSGRNG
jgi:hypothetical protein